MDLTPRQQTRTRSFSTISPRYSALYVSGYVVADDVFPCQAYSTFFQGEEAYEQLLSELEASFKDKNEVVISETDMLKAENEALEKEVAEFSSKPAPIVSLTQTHSQFVSDAKRFSG